MTHVILEPNIDINCHAGGVAIAQKEASTTEILNRN